MGQMAQHHIAARLAAAKAGKALAFYDLGLLYATGAGGRADLIEAHKWFNLAATRGIRRAELDRAELARDMTAFEIAEAQRQARTWLSDISAGPRAH